MTVFMFKYLENFICDIDLCKTCCCKKYPKIEVLEDIVDLYKNKAPELLDIIKSEDENYYLKTDKDSGCPMLENGKCKIQCDYGIEFQPEICHTYPRTFTKIKDNLYISGAFPCNLMMKAALFTEDGFDWVETTLTRIPKKLNHTHNDDINETFFLNLFKQLVNIVDDKNYSSEEALIKLLFIFHQMTRININEWPNVIQETIDSVDDNKIKNCYQFYQDKDNDNKYVDKFFCSMLELLAGKQTNNYIMEVVHKMSLNEVDFNQIKNLWTDYSKNHKLDSILKSYIKARLSRLIFPLNCLSYPLFELIFLSSCYYFIRLLLVINIDKLDNYTNNFEIASVLSYLEEAFYGKYQKIEEVYKKNELADINKTFYLLTKNGIPKF